jgi:hypothetical protein
VITAAFVLGRVVLGVRLGVEGDAVGSHLVVVCTGPVQAIDCAVWFVWPHVGGCVEAA